MKKWLRLFSVMLFFVFLVGCSWGGWGNKPPKIDSLTPEATKLETGLNWLTTFSVTASDPEGDSLQYLWEQTGAGEITPTSLSTAFWRAPDQEGAATVTVTVKDGKRGMVSHTWEITVVDKGEQQVFFEDANLEKAVRDYIEEPDGDLTASDASGVGALMAHQQEIGNPSGIEHCINLRILHLVGNQISDISPLAGLTRLDTLQLGSNKIADISPLAELKSLQWLQLRRNKISDISPLTGLTGLVTLELNENPIRDISALAQLTELMDLNLNDTEITEIEVLEGLTNLRILYLKSNQITDISPLAKLTNLEELSLNANQISDISVLEGLTNLQWLDLRNNRLDLSAGSESMKTIQTLIDRGVVVEYEPQSE